MRPSFAHTFHTSVNSRPVGFFRQAASDGPVCACPHVRRVSCLAPLPPRRSKACPCREPRGARHFSASDRYPASTTWTLMVRFAVWSALGLVAYGSEEAHRGAGRAAYLLLQEGEHKSKRGESNEGCVSSLDYSSPAPSNSPTQFSGDANNT